MNKEKCIVFNFSKGTRVPTAYYHYKNGQLDLDLKIEVMSTEPEYGTNVLQFKKVQKKDSTSTKDQAPPYTA